MHIVTNRIKRIFILIELNPTELSRAVGFRRRAMAVPNSIHKSKIYPDKMAQLPWL